MRKLCSLLNFLILVLEKEKDKMVKQSTTRHKHVTVIVKVVLVVEICIACDKMFAVCRDEFKQNRKTK